MNQNCLIHISHAPARSLDRAQNWDDEGNDGKEDNDENGDGDDIDDLATMSVVVALFTRSSQDAGLEATEPKSEQSATFKVAILWARSTHLHYNLLNHI